MKKLMLICVSFAIFMLLGCEKTIKESKSLITTSKTTEITKKNTEKTSAVIDDSIVVKRIENVKDNTKIYISAFNDTHGQLFRNEDKLGIAEVSAIIKYNEERFDQSYIKIANGDIFQGSYVSRVTDGECFIDALNAMNLTCMVLGNHEFDWTLETIEDYWDGNPDNGEANFPILCCNLLNKETKERPEWVKPYMIVEYGEYKVGIIGAIGSEQESDISPTTLGSYYFDPIVPYYEEACEELRGFGCEFIILSVHDASGLYSQFAEYRKTYAPDCYIFGHTHQSMDGYYTRICDGYDIPYVQSYTKSMNIGEVIINVDNSSKTAINASINHYNSGYFDYYVKNPDENVLNLLNEKYLKTHLEASNVIYRCADSYELSTKEACANFACELMNKDFGSYVSFINSGGVRTTFRKEEITVADIFELFPFDNKIVKMKMKGVDFLTYLDRRSDLLCNYSFDESLINENEIYDVITIDYVATASDSYIKRFCVNNEYEVTDIILRDYICETLMK